MNQITKNILRIYKEKFLSTPSLYFSPGRINLIGEHIDYNDGYVLPAAIDKGIYFAVGVNQSRVFNFYSVNFDEAFSIALEDISKSVGWKNYVLSVINEFLILKKDVAGFDCVFEGDIPQGSGLSSSAAVEGGLAFAINELFGCGLDAPALALLCQRAEHNFPAVNCGIMDQYANMMGKKDEVILLDCKNVIHRYFPLELGDYEIILVNSKVDHSLASSAYNERRQQCEKGLVIINEALGLSSFREINDWKDLLPLQEKMGNVVFDRCKYVVQEINRTISAAELLQQNKIYEFGQLMYDTHEGLSKLYEVSCEEIDFLVNFARNQSSVIGSRLMGGGFGGCSINLVHNSLVADFSERIASAYFEKFKIATEIYHVRASDGTRQLTNI
ncbi:MAG: galactokinase [Chitinophagaceae bacterium]|nr:MAG: galactokinase [Chitinophagaceae bacterium]